MRKAHFRSALWEHPRTEMGEESEETRRPGEHCYGEVQRGLEAKM